MPAWNWPNVTPDYLAFFGIFQSKKSTNINQIRSNHRHMIRFKTLFIRSWINKGQNIKKYQQDKLNLRCVKLRRKQEIILYLHNMTKCPIEAEKIERQKWANYWLRRTKRNQIQQNVHSCTITANIWENNRK